MRLTRILFLNALFALFLTFSAFGVEFQPLGFESTSMGGAGVASAKGSFATYYNPALLSLHKHKVQMSTSVSLGIREINLADHIDKLNDVDIDSVFDLLSSSIDVNTNIGTLISQAEELRSSITTIKSELAALSMQNGIQIMPGITVGMQIGNFGFGIYGMSEATGYAVIDPDRLDVIVEKNGIYFEYDEVSNVYAISSLSEYTSRSLEYALDNRHTYLTLAGVAYLEVPIAYGHMFSTSIGKIGVGGSIKYMPGETFSNTIDIDTESDEIIDELEDVAERTNAWGIDLGVLFKPKAVSNFTFGFVAKNINTPEFDETTQGKYEIKPQYRAGLAYDFAKNRITLAVDLDLKTNETFISDHDTQFLGGGINFRPLSWLSIRGGVMENLQENNEGTIFTAGIGFGLKWLQFDVAGQYSSEEGEFDGNKIPRYSRLQVAVISKWM